MPMSPELIDFDNILAKLVIRLRKARNRKAFIKNHKNVMYVIGIDCVFCRVHVYYVQAFSSSTLRCF